MCVYQKTVMYCLHLGVDTIHRTGIVEHFIHFSQCYITSESRIIMVESNCCSGAVLCAGCILRMEICGVSRFLPYLIPEPVIIRTYCSAVTAGNLTPDCEPSAIIQDAVCL